ncbi:multidrug effflux MFS transporter [Neisseria perflava]|uniref:multidrug effflux MFS transporter n=1 Tax=Neisseria perflava TaxID=33053 RepID=UPI00209EA9C6|nr:multidrug effflux MFS transporter [Neisseria perflava]MCP1661322.1 DHA1 family bicyclomycin/chloramphenicol resistance-like MFS transporter [Neisseria perflava]MCP1773261.1 DHA1 family bicyclomycin/chloramphenicol resistance-like MFS transporter [Neisseria perflava]
MSKQSNTSSLLLLLILSSLMAVTSLTTDIYLPAMPQMAQDLHGDAELTITGFLIGFTFAQLFWGAVSDKIGRKLPLFIGMLLFAAGSVGCAMSDNMAQMVFWRVFQAFGACTGPMLARAMVRDMFERTRAAQMLSTLTMIMSIAPIIGPLLGGQIILFGTWHNIFWLLSLISLVMFAALFVLPEPHTTERRSQGSLLNTFKNYRTLLGKREFMRYTMCVTLFYVAAYAFIAGSPMVYINHFGVAPQHYGYLFALNIVGVMLISFVNRTLVRKFSLDTLLKTATLIATLATLIAVPLVWLHMGGIYSIILAVFIFFSTNGVIAASANVMALDKVPEMAGSASALIGALQYGSGIISSLLLAAFPDNSGLVMMVMMAVFTALSAVTVWVRLPQKCRRFALCE